jgi:hypothetical protein
MPLLDAHVLTHRSPQDTGFFCGYEPDTKDKPYSVPPPPLVLSGHAASLTPY